jgi:PAS domain S-box-containing protein
MKYDDQEGLAQALFEESGDALFLIDPESDRCIDSNSKAQRLTGLPLRKLLNKTTGDLLCYGGAGGLERPRRVMGKSSTFHSQEGYFLFTARPDVWIPISLTVSRLHVKPKTVALLTARDLREQYATRAQLHEAETEFSRALASVAECLWSAEVDTAGLWRYRYVSAVVERITGQPPNFFLAGVHRWGSLVHPEDQSRWEKALLRMRQGESAQEEYRVMSTDGKCRWVRERVRVDDKSPLERLLRLDGVVTDITEHKHLEIVARGGSGLGAALLWQSPLPAFLRDAQGAFVYVNTAFAARFGKTPADMVGHAAAEFLSCEVARAEQQSDAVVLGGARTGTVFHESTAPGREGRWRVAKFLVQESAGRQLVGGLALSCERDRCCRLEDVS